MPYSPQQPPFFFPALGVALPPRSTYTCSRLNSLTIYALLARVRLRPFCPFLALVFFIANCYGLMCTPPTDHHFPLIDGSFLPPPSQYVPSWHNIRAPIKVWPLVFINFPYPPKEPLFSQDLPPDYFFPNFLLYSRGANAHTIKITHLPFLSSHIFFVACEIFWKASPETLRYPLYPPEGPILWISWLAGRKKKRILLPCNTSFSEWTGIFNMFPFHTFFPFFPLLSLNQRNNQRVYMLCIPCLVFFKGPPNTSPRKFLLSFRARVLEMAYLLLLFFSPRSS